MEKGTIVYLDKEENTIQLKLDDDSLAIFDISCCYDFRPKLLDRVIYKDYKGEWIITKEEYEMEITIVCRNGKLIAPYQNEIEDLAIEQFGTHENIYFDTIYLDDAKKWGLSWEDEYKGWVLKRLLES